MRRRLCVSAQVVAGGVYRFMKEGEGGCSGESFSEIMVEAFSIIGHESILFEETVAVFALKA